MQEKNSQREINLLILGETGVGKSTFINGFVNYLTFDTLDQAEAQPELLSLIASSFTIVDDNYQESKVETGKADNENFAVGQSATQMSQVYRFEVAGIAVRIIDTPGIGDVRGVEQDKQNFQNILQTISNLDVLHGILILLKPNNARLDVMFRFCINELLMHLHRSAVQNIIFGFTNSRGTFYKPGDTMPALRELLRKNPSVQVPLGRETIFCFDSESFRFLAAVKKGVQFDDSTRVSFRESWDYSVKETHRLMEKIISVEPHLIHDTTTLNNARNLIVKLTKPLAELTRLIDYNIKISQDKINELLTTQKHGKDLDDSLMVKKIDLEPRQLGYPRTVCTNAACVEVRDWEGIKKIDYITHCHEHCYLSGVQVDTLNTPLLINCYAMQGGQTCTQCQHGYQEHMHVVYELIQVSKTIEDQNIRAQISNYASDADKKQAAINAITSLVDEYRKEHEIVEKAAAQFGCFLKHNAILAYSDARIEYLDHLLKEERAKAQVSGDESLVNSLLETKQMYLEEFKIIEKSIGDGKNQQVLDPKNVAAVESRLYQLKHFGATLKKVRDAGSQAHQHSYKEITYKAPKASNFWRKGLEYFGIRR